MRGILIGLGLTAVALLILFAVNNLLHDILDIMQKFIGG